MIYSSSKNIGYERLSAEVVQLKDRILGYQEQVKSLQGSLKSAEAAKERQKQHYESMIAEKDAVIKELKNKVAHMAAVADHDGTNTGIPTAATPINKKKVIPNSRRGSGRKKGGQPGHARHIMESFEDADVTDVIAHELDNSAETCDFAADVLLIPAKWYQKMSLMLRSML